MNIKSLIASQKVRHFLMKSCFWMPDNIMLSIQYYLISHRWPNLKSPKRFTEKIQYYKMYYRNPVMLQCVDKFAVRKYVADKMGNDDILNRLYQVCNSAGEIDFSTLPNQFVVKTTDGGNGDNVLIVKNKKDLDIPRTIRLINSWRNKKYYVVSREWAYKGASKSQIIVEKYLEDETVADKALIDYKFYCFSGEPYVCQIISDRFSNEHIDFYDMNWNRLHGVVGLNAKATNSPIEFQKPKNFERMIDVAKSLSADFPFVRVDLYNINGAIYFGELTFYPASGYGSFKPDSFDFELGKLFDLAKIQNL